MDSGMICYQMNLCLVLSDSLLPLDYFLCVTYFNMFLKTWYCSSKEMWMYMELLKDLNATKNSSNQMVIQVEAEARGKLWELGPVADL